MQIGKSVPMTSLPARPLEPSGAQSTIGSRQLPPPKARYRRLFLKALDWRAVHASLKLSREGTLSKSEDWRQPQRQNPNRARPTPAALATLSLLLASSAMSEAIPPASAPSSARIVTQTDGKESIIEELSLGPPATELWRKIQRIVADPSYLRDFPKLINDFDFKISDPLDAVSPIKPGFQRRADIKAGPLLKSVEYAIYLDPTTGQPAKRYFLLRLVLETRAICISSDQVQRTYGQGTIQYLVDGWGPRNPNDGPSGYEHTRAYGTDLSIWRIPLAFFFQASGCLQTVRIQQPLSE